MSDSGLAVFGQVAGIGGLALGVLLVLYREVLRRRIFPQLSREQGYRIIRLIIVLTWTVAMIGIASWVYTSTRAPADVPRSSNRSVYGPTLPFNTGWIFVGYYDANPRVFIEGPTRIRGRSDRPAPSGGAPFQQSATCFEFENLGGS